VLKRAETYLILSTWLQLPAEFSNLCVHEEPNHKLFEVQHSRTASPEHFISYKDEMDLPPPPSAVGKYNVTVEDKTP
jgi:hypothetical protein